MTTLKDLIRDEIIQYERDTNDGSAPDAEVLVEAIIDVIKDYITKHLN